MGNLVRGDTISSPMNLPVKPAIPTQDDANAPAKRDNSLKRGELKTECATEAVCDVITRDRDDTPSGIGVGMFAITDGARFTFVRHESSHRAE